MSFDGHFEFESCGASNMSEKLDRYLLVTLLALARLQAQAASHKYFNREPAVKDWRPTNLVRVNNPRVSIYSSCE